MDDRAVLPYGSWPTPVTSELVVSASVTLGSVVVDTDGSTWWAELRPDEAGRTAIVRDGVDVIAAPWNARTAVHEYGGGAWWVRDGVLWFTEWSDQRLHRVDPGAEPVAITSEPDVPRGVRYADGDVHPNGSRIACVRERHPAGGGPADVVNEVVAISTDGGDVEVLVSGPDFVSDPCWSADGSRLAWLEWDHPDMPWDSTRLMVDGELVAGGDAESVVQPRWTSDGALWFASDRTGWCNLYRWEPGDGTGRVVPVVIVDAEVTLPQWVFGHSRYALFDDGRVVVALRSAGIDRLSVWDGTALVDLDLPYTSVEHVTAAGTDVLVVAATPVAESTISRVRLDGTAVAGIDVLRPARALPLDAAWFSTPESITFPSADGRRAHGLHYPPASPTHRGPDGERPPLLVMIHGGPTSAARPMLQMKAQYWTSRGFAVVDVNYGGSTGYGRQYRELLHERWGVVDVEDCIAAARWLAERGSVDADRLCITGGSAGGFTTLACLAGDDTFAAGASHYGVADLEALARDTHKFESRYLDRLIGEYPAQRDRYVERSPIHHVDGFDRPLIVLQGMEDEIVPPSQSEMIVSAVRDKSVPVAYVEFEGEQHGFRRAENVRRALDSELSFYAQVLRFELPASEHIDPVPIANL